MNAEALLVRIAKALHKAKLETILIGNAAAALQGAPVTTVDVDFMFRKTSLNLKKLKVFADEFNAIILRPYYPVSDLYRVTNDIDNLQVDFLSTIHGISSFASLRSRADKVEFAGQSLLVADLADIIKSKTAAGRPQDKAVLGVIKKVLDEKKAIKKSKS